MRDEIAAAVVLVTRMVKQNNKDLTKEKGEQFSEQLTKILVERFKNHWYTDLPVKGQAYRCIRVNGNERRDPILHRAAEDTGILYEDLALPSEFTLWVDPAEVSCRFSELKGHCYTVANFKDGKNENKALTLDIEDLMQENSKDPTFKTQRINGNNEKNYYDNYFKSTYCSQNHYNSIQYYNQDQNTTYYHNQEILKNHSYKKNVPKYKSNITKADRFHWVKPGEMIKT